MSYEKLRKPRNRDEAKLWTHFTKEARRRDIIPPIRWPREMRSLYDAAGARRNNNSRFKFMLNLVRTVGVSPEVAAELVGVHYDARTKRIEEDTRHKVKLHRKQMVKDFSNPKWAKSYHRHVWNVPAGRYER